MTLGGRVSLMKVNQEQNRRVFEVCGLGINELPYNGSRLFFPPSGELWVQTQVNKVLMSRVAPILLDEANRLGFVSPLPQL